MFKNKIKLNIQGKNLQRFIKRLNENHIELLKITYLSDTYMSIIIYKKDYDTLLKLKTIYDVEYVNVIGPLTIKQYIRKYKAIFISILCALIMIIILSNIIFKIEIIHTDSDIRKLLTNELENYGITKYKFKKSFNELQQIKQQILEKYKDKIEWLEIEEKGTRYIVRLEKRIIKDKKEINTNQNVVAKKDGIIKKIIAENGEIIKEVDSYVHKGEVVISGNIYLNDTLKDIVSASGNIYAEVWYNVSVEYPYIYSFSNYTGNEKKVYVLKLFNKNIEFTTNRFDDKIIEENNILSNNILPISLVLQKQKQIVTESGVLTSEQAIIKAEEIGLKKITDKLKEDEKILTYKTLKTSVKEDKIVLEMFVTVLENITDYQIIEGTDNDVS